MPHRFIGRKEELDSLRSLLKKHSSSMIVIKGRRRVGKSRLVAEFAKGYTFYKFSGLPPTFETTKQNQLDEFAKQLNEQTGIPKVSVDDWSALFYLLHDKIKTGRVILLFDEISWMGSEDHNFLGKIKNAWDMYFKENPELIFILCGSVSTWIDKNILSSTGFVGRFSRRYTIEELPLSDCNKFWTRTDNYISPYEKLKMLSVTGGIPRYLEEINPALPADENIKRLAFIKDGPLVHEFDEIFSDIFSKRGPIYKRITKLLADGPKDATELAELLDIEYTGTFNEYLDDLVRSDFVSRDYTWHFTTGKSSKLSLYRLSDNYVRFYLEYIEPSMAKIERNSFKFQSLSSLPGWNSIMGYQFENMVLKNRHYIIAQLGINYDDIVTDNPYFQRTTAKMPGCQIDYLIQTKSGLLYVCEMKFMLNPITTAVIKEMQEKIKRLKRPKGFSVWPVLIYANEVQQEVIDSGYFAKIIDFSKILSDGE